MTVNDETKLRTGLSKMSKGAIVDLLYKTREGRYKAQRAINELKKTESNLKDEIQNRLKDEDIDGCSGKVARVENVRAPIVRVIDFMSFVKWCVKHDAPDALMKRANKKAVLDRMADGKEVDGVVSEEMFTLSITKK